MAKLPGISYQARADLGRPDINEPTQRLQATIAQTKAAQGVAQKVDNSIMDFNDRRYTSEETMASTQASVLESAFTKKYDGKNFIDGKPRSEVIDELYQKEVVNELGALSDGISNKARRDNWLQDANKVAANHAAKRAAQTNQLVEAENQERDEVSLNMLVNEGNLLGALGVIDGMAIEQSDKDRMRLQATNDWALKRVSDLEVADDMEGQARVLKELKAGQFDTLMPNPDERTALKTRLEQNLKVKKEENKREKQVTEAYNASIVARKFGNEAEGVEYLEKKYANNMVIGEMAIQDLQNHWAREDEETRKANVREQEAIILSLDENPDQSVDNFPVRHNAFVRAELAARARDSQVVTNEGTRINLLNLAQTNPEKFRVTDLTQYSAELSPTDRRNMAELQLDLRNNKTPAIMTEFNASKAMLERLGFNAKNIHDEQEAAITSVFLQQIADKTDELGRPLTDFEQTKVLNDFVVSHRVNKNYWPDTVYKVKSLSDTQTQLIPLATSFLNASKISVNQGNVAASTKVLEKLEKQAAENPAQRNSIMSKQNYLSEMQAIGIQPEG